ncbi:MAG TPA: DUF2071 domain-containing protein [Acidobacteriaceae bacterium]|nr:DUF2071 domain-containing protein [Acidobacteriaceae bacterium]
MAEGRRLLDRHRERPAGSNVYDGPTAGYADTSSMRATLEKTSHRPWPLPPGRWAMTQRWNDLLFAHWPMRIAEIEALLPEGLEADVFQGSAWIGVVPFWMDNIRMRGMPQIPGARKFPELNLRTYVRDRRTSTPGVYFFSLDAASLIAVIAARSLYHLPYYWAQMSIKPRGDREFSYYSRRLLSGKPVQFAARYRGLGPTHKLAQTRLGTIEYFLTERYCLFSLDGLGRLQRADIHHIPWPLEEAEAEITQNDLASHIGLQLPETEPLLHYSRHLAVYVWPAELVQAKSLVQGAAVAAAQ